MSTIIQVEIKDCQDCPFCKSERHWTSDSWEHAYDYYCSNMPDLYVKNGKTYKHKNLGENSYKKIASYIEWRHEMPEVPNWCPIRVK